MYNDQGGRQFVVFRLPGGEAVPVGMESDMVAYLDGVRSTHTVSAADPDVLLQRLAKAGVRYVMLASLRVDPSRNTGQIITTVQRYLFYLSVKYPAILGETLYTAGTSEPTAIVRLNY